MSELGHFRPSSAGFAIGPFRLAERADIPASGPLTKRDVVSRTHRLHPAVSAHQGLGPPYGGHWLHEIKHDGFRVIARKDGGRVRLYSRPGNDLTGHFPLIVEALARLRSRSCIIDGEAVACDESGIGQFNRIRYRSYDGSVFLSPWT